MTNLDALDHFFDQIPMSPADWPMHVVAAVAGERTFQRWPDFPAAATLPRGRLGHGAGEDIASAVVRAVGELIEIASCCAPGDEAMILATPAELGGGAFDPVQLSGFSAAQRLRREEWNRDMDGLDWIPPDPTDPTQPIAWIEARDLFCDDPILVPADSVLIGRREKGDPLARAVADTNGCAAGETAEAALLAALFELVERDATGRWWYGRRPAPILDAAEVPVDAAVIANLRQRGRRLWLLDITSDLAIPTIAALAADAAGRHVGAGFATRSTFFGAAQAAVRELMQMELRIAAELARSSPGPALARWFAEIEMGRAVPIGSPSRDARFRAKAQAVDLASCIDRLDAHGCRVATIDFTKAAFAVPVVRAISPDLGHWKPRLGRMRLPVGPDAVNPWLLRI